MPLAVRTIEPVYLGRRPLREEEKGEEVVQVAIIHNAVLGALVQLASLVRHADDLFCDLADECQKVFEQTERIMHRVKRIKQGVGRLDPKKVSIPLGDLKRFSTVQDHHVSRHGFDCSFFTPDSRLHCIKGRYSLCQVTPVGALRGVDLYRKDGMRGSNLFKLWPFVLREHQTRTPDMNLPRKRGKAIAFDKKYKRLTPRPRTVHGTENLDISERAEHGGGSAATGSVNEGSGLSKSQPSIMVAVDTSGTGFYRMSSFRRSLKEMGTGTGAGAGTGAGTGTGTMSLDRKKRRRTVSGVPEHIMHEIQVFEREKRHARKTPRDYSFEDIVAPSHGSNKDESMLQYFNDMDARMEEKAQLWRASRELGKLLKYLPCRRSRSLPRCMKVGTGSNFDDQTRGVMVFEQEESSRDRSKSITTAASGSHSSSLSLGSTGASSSSSRSTRRSSIIGSKIRSFMTGTLRPRPKSLDLDAIDVLGNDADNEDDGASTASAHHHHNSNSGSKSSLNRQLSPSVPDSISSNSTSSRESKENKQCSSQTAALIHQQPTAHDHWKSRVSSVGPGTYYYFSSSTLPQAQARKYDFPWESLPKDWTTSVKLREISKRRREERNSSSGNWSGSSNRQSVESARSSTLPSSTSQYSLGRDSGRDSPSAENRDLINEQAAKDSGISTFLPLRTRRRASHPAAMDTEQWLSSLGRRVSGREDALATGGHITKSLGRLSELTRQNIQALEDTLSPQPLLKLDEELSSVHSVDQEGFYTSFHNDSGLRHSTGTLLEGREFKPVKNAHSALSVGSSNTVDSVIFRPLGDSLAQSVGDKGTAQGSSIIRLRPPPPLRCGSRLSSTSSLVDAQETLKRVGEALAAAEVTTSAVGDMLTVNNAAHAAESSPSESSDLETIYTRLQAKTKISPRTIPSWCLISDEDSTDSSSMCLNRGAQIKTPPSISVFKTVLDAGDNPKSTPLTDFSSRLVRSDAKGGNEDNIVFNCSTLPLRYLESKVWEEDLPDHCNSWPRSRYSRQAGILKRDKSPAESLKLKTLNFAPTVNMFDQGTSQNVEIPLQAASSTSSSSSMDASTKGPIYKLSLPLSRIFSRSKSQVKKKSRLGHDYENGMDKSGPGAFPRSLSVPGSFVSPQLYAVSEVAGTRSGSVSESSSASSASSLPSLSDCGQGRYLDMSGQLGLGHRSQDTLTSISSAALSDLDVDSSMTYVSMSSASSTPTNSSQALCLDDQSTPVNSPRLQHHDTYRISPATLSRGRNTQEPPHSAPASCKSVTPAWRQSLGSVASSSGSARVSVAPMSLAEVRSNYRTSSEDSGFSSPTTPTTMAMAGTNCQLQHHPPSASQMTPVTTKVQSTDPQSKDIAEHGSENYTSICTTTPSSQLLIGSLRTSHSVDSSATTSRSNFYMAAGMKDFQYMGRKGSDGSVGAKRSQSSSETTQSSTLSLHQHPLLSKSMSCPLGVGEGVTRADSYRNAVRNTQGIVGDNITRNTSYRLATQDDDPFSDDHMEVANTWCKGQKSSGSCDTRRMGITDIDQLKCYDSDSTSSRASLASANTRPTSKGFAGINSSRKKMRPEVENLLRGDKTPSPKVKRMSKEATSKGTKEKDKAKMGSSTYIRFDPIFEHGDDMFSSTDTLQADSVEMIASEGEYLMVDKVVSQLPPGKVRGASGGRKQVDEKAVMSILDSIKTTIRSMSGKSSS